MIQIALGNIIFQFWLSSLLYVENETYGCWEFGCVRSSSPKLCEKLALDIYHATLILS
jgi:hypothetical protein